MTKTENLEFKRELSLFDSTMIVVGIMIGSGIFIVSADVARMVGSSGYLLLIWLVTGLFTLVGALCYRELAGMMPYAGGKYVYLREAYNPLMGFLYGWTYFLVIGAGTIAAVAVAFAKFTSVLLPQVSEKNILLTLPITESFSLNISAAQILAILVIAGLTAINLRGLQSGKIIQNFFTVTKTLALVGLVVLGIFLGSNSEAISTNWNNFWNASYTEVKDGNVVTNPLTGMLLLTTLGLAMVGPLFSSDGWYNITFTSGEVKDPKRNVPLSLALGVGLVTLIYFLANVAYIVSIPLLGNPNAADVAGRGIQFATNDRVGTAAASVIFGEPAVVIMSLLIMVSTFGCVNGLILSASRNTYAMANDGLFFSKVGTLNKNSVPGTALILQGIWASVLCLSGKYGDLLDYVIFASMLFFMFTVIGVFILRKKRPNLERPYKALAYPIVPAIYVIFCALICLDLLAYKPQYTWPGLGIVSLGIPVYLCWRLLNKSAAIK